MSVLGTIISRVFGHESAAAAAPATPATAPAAPAATAAPSAPAAAASNPAAAQAVLEQLAAKNPQKLDWQHSIVDLMKLVHMNPTLEARRELAKELGYTGDTSDTATMNVWLHEQVMAKLAENGGGVAQNLLH
jgi:3-oxoacyl-ACP reductase-like protein